MHLLLETNPETYQKMHLNFFAWSLEYLSIIIVCVEKEKNVFDISKVDEFIFLNYLE